MEHKDRDAATDSDGQTGEDQITVDISAGATCEVATTASCQAKGPHLDVTIQVADAASGAAVSGVLVIIDLHRNGGLDKSYSGTTGSEGFVTFRRSKAPLGSYTIGAISVDDCAVSLTDPGYVK